MRKTASRDVLVSAREILREATTFPAGARGVRHLTGLDAAQLGLLATMVASEVISAVGHLGWRSALASDLVAVLWVALMLSRRSWRRIIAPLAGMGLVAGVFELFTDFSGHFVANSLDYPSGQPMLWASPIYMPLSWMLVLVQLGYLAWRVRGLLPLWPSIALVAAVGAINVPFYEEMAFHANWWRYAPVTLMLGNTPLYVVVFEGLIAASLPVLTAGLVRWGWREVVTRGALVGLWMPIAALLAWLPLGTW
ncbi:MAG TPA: hypothetical protein VF807_11910 [Ktedonobacterales bacterium]